MAETTFTLRIEPFDYPVTVALGDAARDAVLGTHGRVDSGIVSRAAVYTLDCKNEPPALIVHLPLRYDAEMVTHESLHLVIELLDIVGIPVTPANQELVAYMQGYVIRRIREECYPTPRGTKRKSRVQ